MEPNISKLKEQVRQDRTGQNEYQVLQIMHVHLEKLIISLQWISQETVIGKYSESNENSKGCRSG